VLLLLLLLAGSLLAELPIPTLTGRVVDQAGLLSSKQRQVVERAIMELEKNSGGQMAILTIPSLKGDVLEDFSIRVADRWKIGQKGKDNGLILLVVKKERKLRFEVGEGWEGKINDARAGDIIRDMESYFRAGKYDQGLFFAVGRVHEFITGKQLTGAPVAMQNKSRKGRSSAIPVIIFFITFGLIVVFRIRHGYYYSGIGFYSGRSSWGGCGGSGGGGFGGGGFSGGGGGFSGGGASGGW